MSSKYSKLSPDERRKADAVDRVVDIILDLGIDDYAEALLGMYGRWEILGQTSYVYITPIMTMFYGREGVDIAEVIGLNPREGSALILRRLKEVKAERIKEELYDKEREIPRSGIMSWLSEKLHRKK